MHEDLREKAKLAALEYLRAVEKDTPPRSYIPPSGKKIGAEELAAMIDASLDMWLTAGRFNDEFEAFGLERKLARALRADLPQTR